MTPLYQHDCSNCKFLGIDSPKKGEPLCNGVDMYVHGNTFVRRYSSFIAEYGAMSIENETSRYQANREALNRKEER